MSSSDKPSEQKGEITKREERGIRRIGPKYDLDNVLYRFRRDLEELMEHPWSSSFLRSPSLSWKMPFFDEDIRVPVCDMLDKGDKYQLQVEVPGIEKEQIDVKAMKNSIEISGEKSEKSKEKSKDYLYDERSYKSFRRRISIPEEIVPSKIEAKMNNGVLFIDAPKKTPTKVEEEVKKIEVK